MPAKQQDLEDTPKYTVDSVIESYAYIRSVTPSNLPVSDELNVVEEEVSVWIFGYGSLMWYPGFEFHQVRKCRAFEYERLMWQGNMTCRGSIEMPGRVATILPKEGTITYGLLYRVKGREMISKALNHLHVREIQVGYNFEPITVQCLPESEPASPDTSLVPSVTQSMDEDASSNRSTDSDYSNSMAEFEEIVALTVVAWPDNHLFLPGSEKVPLEIMATEIAHTRGSKGRNSDYVLKLAQSMREHFPGCEDDHLFDLEKYILGVLEREEGQDPSQIDLGFQKC